MLLPYYVAEELAKPLLNFRSADFFDENNVTAHIGTRIGEVLTDSNSLNETYTVTITAEDLAGNKTTETANMKFVYLVDLVNFADQWLQVAPDLEADLDDSGSVDFSDFAILGLSWRDICPPGWPL